jgi:NTP pyrophosphatase (non-canonical NTP hydrolase)
MATALDEYQVATRETAIYPAINGMGYMYPLLGLSGEVGEVMNKVKKIFRDDAGVLTDERRLAIRDELGDVLWYLARTADEFGFTLSEIGDSNLTRLQDRKKRDLLNGSGDNR